MKSDLQLNYHHLRYFWEVANSGSLRVAAEKMNVSQPTISAQVKSLEESLEVQLFSRSGRGLKLTAAGRMVMEYAREIFGLGERLLEGLTGSGEAKNLRLSLGVTDSFAKLLAWNLVRPAIQKHPGIRVQCAEGKTGELLSQLVTGRLDMVLADEPAPSTLAVKAFSHLLGEARLVFASVPALVEKLKPGFPKSLNGAPVLLPAPQTAWRHHLDHWFETQGVRPKVVGEFDDSALMKTAAADGFGIAPIVEPVMREASLRYGLEPISAPVNCGFSAYIITVERSLRHPAIRSIARAASTLFVDQQTQERLKGERAQLDVSNEPAGATISG
jgi:LysR family transcriptional activator of nhaA